MKKDKQHQFDLYEILFRRKWNVAQLLESENIKTESQFEAWKTANSNSYLYSNKFNEEAFEYLVNICTLGSNEPTELPEEISNVVQEEQEIVEFPKEDLEQPISNKKTKKKVQTEEETE